MHLVIATRNAHKLDEIHDIFDFQNLEVMSAFDFPDIPDVVEDRDTLEGNAIKKAVTLATASGLWAIADDTGLEVEALNGEPGVYSARYAGEGATYADNNRKLLDALAGQSNRRACFRTAVALSDPLGHSRWVEGECPGTIIQALRGEEGFGYDPIFLPDGHTRTFAEMDATTKNAISHRARAFHAMSSVL